MANPEKAKNVFDNTSAKLRFMLESLFCNDTEAEEILKQIYADVFSAAENPTEADVFIKAAEICFDRIGRPERADTTDFSVEDMLAFFENCENYDTPVGGEGIDAVDVLNTQTDSLDPISKLIVFLRMYCDMTVEEISRIAGNNEAVTATLFKAYRSIMPNAAQICMSTPALQGLPALQLVRISLLKQGFNTASPENIFDSLFVTDTVIAPEPDKPAFESVEETEQPIIEDVYSDSDPNSDTMSIPTDFVVDPIDDFEAPEWSYVKTKFGFDFSDEKNLRFSEAYSLIAQGYTDSAKEILFSINRDAPNAASFLGLLMIDAGASTPDDLMNIHIDYASLPSFKAADYYGNSQLKDFLDNLLDCYEPVQVPVPPQPPTPPQPPVPTPQPPVSNTNAKVVPAPSANSSGKKSNTGLIIGIIAGVAVLAIAAVVAILFATGMISISSGDDIPEETMPVVEMTEAPEETTTEVPTTQAPPAIKPIELGTSTVTIDRMENNKFEFRPTQSGYYAFVSEEYGLDLAAELYFGSSCVDYSDDTNRGQNFMVIGYCEAFSPVTLSVFEIENGSGTADVKLTVYKLGDSEGEALVRYLDYFENSITITTSATLYSEHSFDSTLISLTENYEYYPQEYYIDESSRILWLAIPAETGYIWYPDKY